MYVRTLEITQFVSTKLVNLHNFLVLLCKTLISSQNQVAWILSNTHFHRIAKQFHTSLAVPSVFQDSTNSRWILGRMLHI